MKPRNISDSLKDRRYYVPLENYSAKRVQVIDAFLTTNRRIDTENLWLEMQAQEQRFKSSCVDQSMNWLTRRNLCVKMKMTKEFGFIIKKTIRNSLVLFQTAFEKFGQSMPNSIGIKKNWARDVKKSILFKFRRKSGRSKFIDYLILIVIELVCKLVEFFAKLNFWFKSKLSEFKKRSLLNINEAFEI
ncbi:MAG: hypothetical protein AAF600_14395 [Bacteroidota bacterium]